KLLIDGRGDPPGYRGGSGCGPGGNCDFASSRPGRFRPPNRRGETDIIRVKICGLMSEADVKAAVRAGADSLGFVTEYPVPVPWNISRARTRQLAASAPPFVTTTAVVGGVVEEMVSIARAVRPHFLQLHGDETLEEIQA